MHPVLFKIPAPGFLQSVFGEFITGYSYGFLIVIGAITGVTYLYFVSKRRYNTSFDTINTLFLLLLAAGFAGGKLFMIFEDPGKYLENPGKLLGGSGFVFYGSLLFCVPVMLYFFRRYKLPVWAMLDVMAVVTCIVHFFGRLGCFMAGCCYGTRSTGPFTVIFRDQAALAPTNVPLHPTQLYSASLILTIFLVLIFISYQNHFPGQVFLTYLIFYAVGRSVIEIYRGDAARGYVIENILSNSQFISAIIFAFAVYFYYRLHHQYRLQKNTV